ELLGEGAIDRGGRFGQIDSWSFQCCDLRLQSTKRQGWPNRHFLCRRHSNRALLSLKAGFPELQRIIAVIDSDKLVETCRIGYGFSRSSSICVAKDRLYALNNGAARIRDSSRDETANKLSVTKADTQQQGQD